MTDTGGYQPQTVSLSRYGYSSLQEPLDDREITTRMRLLSQRNPYMADNGEALYAMASSGMDTETLLATGSQHYGMQVGDNLANQLKGMSPGAQRAVIAQLSPQQQAALQQMGYQAPGYEEDDGGLLSMLGEAVSFVGKGIGQIPGVSEAGGAVLEGLTWVGNWPGHLYRTVRLMDDSGQWAGLVGAIAGAAAVALAIPTGGGSLLALGSVGLGAIGGASVASFLTNPMDWSRAFNASWDGEKTFDRAAQGKARKLLDDGRMYGIASDLAAEDIDIYELSAEMAGERDVSMNSQLRKIEAMASRMAQPGSVEHQQAVTAMINALNDSTFQTAVQSLVDGKMSPGRDFVDALTPFDTDTSAYNFLSGAIDAVFTVAVDPTLMLGKANKFIKSSRYTMRVFDGAEAATEFMRVASKPAVLRFHTAVAEAVAMGDRGGLSMMRSLNPTFERDYVNLLNYGRAMVEDPTVKHMRSLADFTVDDLHTYYKDWTNLKPMLEGIGSVANTKGIELLSMSKGREYLREFRIGARAFTEGLSDVRVERWIRAESKRTGREIIREQLPPEFESIVTAEGMIGKEWRINSQAPGLYEAGHMLGKIKPIAKIGDVITSMTTMAPKGRAFALTGQNAAADIRALSEMGRYMGMSSWARKAWADTILSAPSIATRATAIDGMMVNMLKLAGLDSTAEGAKILSEFSERSKQLYSMSDNFVANGHKVNAGLFLKEMADFVTMPNFDEVRKLVSTTKLTKLMGILDIDVAQAAITKIWKPAVLLRLGFIPRAAGEELLNFVSRGGIGSMSQEFGGRFLGYQDAYKAALELKNEYKAVTLMQDEIIGAGWLGTIPAHARPLVRIASRIGFGDAMTEHLAVKYRDFVINSISTGFGKLDPIETKLANWAGQSLGASRRDLGYGIHGGRLVREIGDGTAAKPVINARKLNVADHVNAIFLGNEYSLRRMILGGVHDDKVLAGKVWHEKHGTTIMRELSAGSAGPIDTGLNNEDLIWENRPDRKGKLRPVRVHNVPGERAYTGDKADRMFQYGVHDAMKRAVSDPMLRPALPIISRTKGAGVTITESDLEGPLTALLAGSGSTAKQAEVVQQIALEMLGNFNVRSFEATLEQMTRGWNRNVGQVLSTYLPHRTAVTVEDISKALKTAADDVLARAREVERAAAQATRPYMTEFEDMKAALFDAKTADDIAATRALPFKPVDFQNRPFVAQLVPNAEKKTIGEVFDELPGAIEKEIAERTRKAVAGVMPGETMQLRELAGLIDRDVAPITAWVNGLDPQTRAFATQFLHAQVVGGDKSWYVLHRAAREREAVELAKKVKIREKEHAKALKEYEKRVKDHALFDEFDASRAPARTLAPTVTARTPEDLSAEWDLIKDKGRPALPSRTESGVDAATAAQIEHNYTVDLQRWELDKEAERAAFFKQAPLRDRAAERKAAAQQLALDTDHATAVAAWDAGAEARRLAEVGERPVAPVLDLADLQQKPDKWLYDDLDAAYEDIVTEIRGAIMNPNMHDAGTNQAIRGSKFDARGQFVDTAMRDATVVLYQAPALDGRLTYEDVLAASTKKELIQSNEAVVRALLVKTGDVGLVANYELAQELFAVRAARIKEKTGGLATVTVPRPRSMQMPRNVLDGRIHGKEADGVLYPEIAVSAGDDVQLWRMSAPAAQARMKPTPDFAVDVADEWARAAYKRLNDVIGRKRQYNLRPKRHIRIDKKGLRSEVPIVHKYDEFGDLQPYHGEVIPEDRNKLYTASGTPIKPDSPEFFEPGPQIAGPAMAPDILWEGMSNVMRDNADDMFGALRFRRKEATTQVGRRGIQPEQSAQLVPVYRANVDDLVGIDPTDLPSFVITQLMEHKAVTKWEAFVRFGFDQVIGPSIDAIVRKPMAFHQFSVRLAGNRAAMKWALDPVVMSKMTAVQDAFHVRMTEGLTDFPYSVPEFTHMIKRIAAHDTNDIKALEWTTDETLSFLAGFESNDDIADMFTRVLTTAKANAGSGGAYAYAKQLSKHDVGELRKITAWRDEPEAWLHQIAERLPPDALKSMKNLKHEDVQDVIANEWPEYLSLTDEDWATIIAAKTNVDHVMDTAAESAALAAIADVVPFLDSHEFRTQFADYGKNFLPFWYAEENFMKRWARTIGQEGPAVIRKLQLTYMGMKHAGVVRTDESGKDWFVYPGSGLLNEGLQKLLPGVDVNVMFQSPTDQMLPGMTNQFGTPAFSPLVTIPMEIATILAPELQPIERGMMGDFTSQRKIIDQIIPGHIRNLFYATLGDVNATGRYASAQMSAIAYLEAHGDGLPDNATPGQLDEFMDRVGAHARVIVLAQALAGFATPGSPSTVEGASDNSWTGLGLDDPADILSDQYLTLVRLLGVEGGTAKFLEMNPDSTIDDVVKPYDGIVNPLAYTIPRNVSVSGAPLPSTEDALAFAQRNEAYLAEFPDAGPWLMPQNYEAGSRSQYAYDQQTVMGMRKRRTPEELLRAMKYKLAAQEYFPMQEGFLEQITAAQLANDPQRAKDLTTLMDRELMMYRAAHPIFREELESGKSGQRRERIIAQLQSIINDPMAPGGEQLDGVRLAMNAFNTYQARMGALVNDRSNIGRREIDNLKTEFVTFMDGLTTRRPGIMALWTSVLRPESNL